METKRDNLRKCRKICIRHKAGELISCQDILFLNLFRPDCPEGVQRIIERIDKWSWETAKAYQLKQWHKWFKKDYIQRWGIGSWIKNQEK